MYKVQGSFCRIIIASISIFFSGSVLSVTSDEVKDGLKFIEVLKPKADDGNAIAQYHLGTAYSFAIGGVPKDPKKAFYYLELSSKQGYAKAQYNLAASYKLGDIVPQNRDKALHWYLEAANQNHSKAQLQAALILLKTNENKKAISLFEKAAKSGEKDSQFILASIYYSGEGVPQNFRSAYIWYSIAAANNDSEAIQLRDEVAKKLTPDELSSAQKDASDIFEKIP